MTDLARVQALVRSELGAREKNAHGWSFARKLLDPPHPITVRSGTASFQVWAILEEDPTQPSTGYTVAYDPQEQAFCLVSGGVAVSYYRSLPEAIDGM
jgi:hypothetical protein